MEEKIDRLLEALSNLNQKVEAMQKQLSSYQESLETDTPKIDELSVKFLFEEYKSLSDTWKHVDSRLGSTLSLYIAVSGAVVPAVAFITKDSKNTNLFLITLSLAALIMAFAGMLISRRITTTGVVKSEYFYAISLIRGFFVDHDVTIAPYLFLPFVNEPAQLTEAKRLIFKVSATNRYIIITHIWLGILVGFSISTITWLILPSIPLLVIVIMGILTSVSFSHWLETISKREIKNRVSMLWDRRQSLLSSLDK